MSLHECEKMVNTLLKRGATECEAYIEDTTETIITIDRGVIHGKKKKKSLTFGLRTLMDKRKGFIAGSLPVKSYDEIEKASLYITRNAVPDDNWNHLPYPKGATFVEGIYDKKLAHIPVETIRDDVKTMITTAQEPDITIDSGKVTCTVKEFFIVNSHGVSYEYGETHLSVHFVCRCKQSESTWGVHSSRQYDADFAALAEKTVEQARAIINPQSLNSFTGEAILLPEPVEDIILTPLRWCFNAETAEKTKFQQKFNEKVASDVITIVDDGTISKGIHTSPVDGEGNPTCKTPLIKKGVLCGLLHTEYTAHIYGVQSTGNAVRRASTEPQIGITNLCTKEGTSTTDELIQDVKKGILIGDFSGNTDPFTGLFSGVIEHSFSIEKGELAHPVTGIMIHGNIYDLLQNVVDMGQEKRTGEGGIYAVPMLVRNLNIISF